jgi:hypothetical protein
VVYGVVYDVNFKMSLRGGRKSAAELMDLPNLKVVVTEILEIIEAEKEKANPTQALASDDIVMGELEEGEIAEEGITVQGLEKLDLDSQQKVEQYRKKAEDTVNRSVRLVVEPATFLQAAAIISSSVAGQHEPDSNNKKIVVNYDVKSSGEAVTHPHIRKPPFRSTHFNKLITAVFNAHPAPGGSEMSESVHEDDIFLLRDGGKHGPVPELPQSLSVPVTQ